MRYYFGIMITAQSDNNHTCPNTTVHKKVINVLIRSAQ
ncbi:hypothetical protein AO385_0783 [Moraxella catarrhalis]|uniref:Uncharacterized protein n=1 Tax=Moraxella catarrhalis TaxID=480 RepID=A0A198UML6_MORCA|nr:hypothetical protein AO384_0570 [Moraxella catarrhalis]OAU98846.1 hypothetical protein AO383_0412 [Moraxella catarrhalis]OAV01688.1 hypothetical protein AO382_0054 [Moraxella catarrhalis]OAV02938.1 hypothetical protein AO385_0783 [Moraxella catarrhalis]OAV30081.1 hypothetical protein AO368_0951 [Moraxella catarrhalis]